MLGLWVILIMAQHVTEYVMVWGYFDHGTTRDWICYGLRSPGLNTEYVGVRGYSDHGTTREYWICYGLGLLWSWQNTWLNMLWLGVTLIMAQHVNTEYVGVRGYSDHGSTREYWICYGLGLLWSRHNTWLNMLWFGVTLIMAQHVTGYVMVWGYSDPGLTCEYWICWG